MFSLASLCLGERKKKAFLRKIIEEKKSLYSFLFLEGISRAIALSTDKWNRYCINLKKKKCRAN